MSKKDARETVFGRDTILKDDLLQQLDKDGDGKIGLSEIKSYVNDAMNRETLLRWYKFAATFAAIVIVLQTLATFGVAIWANSVSQEVYVGGAESDHLSLQDKDGVPLVATGYKEGVGDLDQVYEYLEQGASFSKLSGVMYSCGAELGSCGAEHHQPMRSMFFNYNLVGMDQEGDEYTLYASNGIELNVSTAGINMKKNGESWASTQDIDNIRRRLADDWKMDSTGWRNQFSRAKFKLEVQWLGSCESELWTDQAVEDCKASRLMSDNTNMIKNLNYALRQHAWQL